VSEIAIRVEHLSKRYRLGVINNGALFRDIQTWIALKRGKEDPHSRIDENKYSGAKGYFWALKDITVDIVQGDRIGIIGKNGAGKSTLLRLLSRITCPTEGQIKIQGKVTSLLEVGTGFHKELTGRENIYLNGAILGMKKRSIDKRLEEIIAFSGIEQHIDTPVKRYSSGMYVRLAFAVAAHLDSDILIADEVLAVGDVEFQKKALGKMQDISAGQGRTVLFVSHNMGAVNALCKKALLLENGQMAVFTGNVDEVIHAYMNGPEKEQNFEWHNAGDEWENPYFKPLALFLTDEAGGKISQSVSNNASCWINITGEITELSPQLTVGYVIYNSAGLLYYGSYFTDSEEGDWPKLQKGFCHLRSRLPRRLLPEDDYRIEAVGKLRFQEWLFEPENGPSIGLSIAGRVSDSPYYYDKRPGLLAPIIKWEKL
jgi:lipopolysaccharide transport system ATP-binding protein